jgi:probable HAF family extracellular repeat protein/autotransporter-associated beta strand protein
LTVERFEQRCMLDGEGFYGVQYERIDLPAETRGYAEAINNAGAVVGYFYYVTVGSQSSLHGFLHDGRLRDFGAETVVEAINNRNVAVGRSNVGPNSDRIFRYDGVISDLGGIRRPGADVDLARIAIGGINDSGVIVGEAGDWGFSPFLHDGTIRDLSPLFGPELRIGSFGGATGINNSGTIVGSSFLSRGYPTAAAWIYEPSEGDLRELWPFAGGSYATDINDRGWVVGEGWKNSDGYGRAFLYDGSTMHDLGTLGGRYSHAKAIDNHGRVVGISQTQGGAWHSFLYDHYVGHMQDLGDVDVEDINDWGQIAGSKWFNLGNNRSAHLPFRTAPLIRLTNEAVAENEPGGTSVGMIVPNEESRWGEPTQSDYAFELVAGSGAEDNHLFSIDQGVLRTAARFDFEASRKVYSVRVRATDLRMSPEDVGRSAERSHSVYVFDVNEPPTNLSMVSEASPGLQAGQLAGTLTVTDPDENETLEFALADGVGGSDNFRFRLEQSGASAQLVATERLIVVRDADFSVRVSVMDSAGNQVEKAFVVTVKANQPPSDIAWIASNTMVAHLPVGTVVSTLAAIDSDDLGNFQYSLAAGEGGTDNWRFRTDGNQLKTAYVFDVDADTEYSVRLAVTDSAGNRFEKTFSIWVVANAPPTDIFLSNYAVPDGQPADSIVARLDAADIDKTVGDLLVFSLVSGQGDADNGSFRVESRGGSSYLVAANTLSGGVRNGYSVRLAATDAAGHRIERSLVIRAGAEPSGRDAGDSLSTALATSPDAFAFGHTATIGDGYYGELSSDVDLYSIVAQAGQELQAFVKTWQIGSTVDSYLRVFDSTGQQLAGHRDSVNYTVSASGTYFVGVSSVRNSVYDPRTMTERVAGPQGPYEFFLRLISPNQAPTAVSLVNTATTLADTISTASRVKVADIVVTDDGSGINDIWLSGPDAANFEVEGLSLYLAAGTVLDATTKVRYEVTLLCSDSSLPGSLPVTASMTLTIVPEGDAEGDTLATALTVTLGSTTFIRAATIGDGAYGSGDVDLYSVSLDAGTKLTAEVYARRLTPTSSLDSYLRLFNDAGQQLTYDDDSAGSNDSRISQYTIPTTGVYYLGVSAYGNRGYDPTVATGRTSSSTGPYELHVTTVVPVTNTAPTAVSVLPIYTPLPKTSASGTATRIAVAEISVDDDGQGTNVFSLSGPQASDFEVRDDGLNGFRLYLKAGVVLDPAIQSMKNVTVSVRDSSLPDAPVSGTYSASITAEATQLVFGQRYSSTLPPAVIGRPQHSVDFYLTGGALDAATLSLADFVLTRDSVTVPWTAAAGGGATPELFVYSDSGSIFGIGHLTAAVGSYQIRFTGNATDIVGTLLPAASFSWTNTSPVSRIDGANGWAFLTAPTTDSEWLGLAGLTVADDGSTITFGSFSGTVDFDSRPDVTTTLTSKDAGTGESGFVARYNAAGVLVAAWSIDATISAVATSGSRVTVGGTFMGTDVDLDPRAGITAPYDAGPATAFFLVTFDTGSGVPSATHVYQATPATGGSGSSWSSSSLTAITTAADGRLYFSGRLDSASLALGSSSSGPVGLSVPAGQSDGFVAAFAANGSPLWARRMLDSDSSYYSTTTRGLILAQPSGSAEVLAFGVARRGTLGIIPSDSAPTDGEALVIGLDATSGVYRWSSSIITGEVGPGDSVPMTLTGDGRVHAAASVLTQNPSGDRRVESGMITINPATGTRMGSAQSLGALLNATGDVYVYVSGLMPRADNAVVVAGMTYSYANSPDDSMYLLHVPASTGSGTPVVTSRQYLHSGWTSASGMTADGRLVFTSSVSNSDTYPTGSGFALERLISPNQYDAAVWSIRDPFATSSPAITVPTGQTVTDATTHTGSYQLVKQGGGTLILDQANSHSGGTVIEAGTIVVKDASALGTGQVRIKAGATLVIDPVAGEAAAGSLVIEEGGFVDLGTGRIRIVAGMTSTALVDALLKGKGDGSWTTSAGIGSSAVSAAAGMGTLRTIGWLDNGDGSFTAGFAAQGDTNMDGAVDILDASNFMTSAKYDGGIYASWIEGDFNYDGSLDILDATDFFNSALFDQGTYLVSASAPAAMSATEPVAVAAAEQPSAIDSAFAALAFDTTATPPKRKNPFASFR